MLKRLKQLRDSGILQLIGILIIIVCTIALYKVRAQGHECAWIYPNHTVEPTGLYGNCTYLSAKADNYNIIEHKITETPWTH